MASNSGHLVYGLSSSMRLPRMLQYTEVVSTVFRQMRCYGCFDVIGTLAALPAKRESHSCVQCS